MISWFQRSFQRHFRIIFALLLGVTVISFIFTIGSTPGIGRDDRGAVKRVFFGYDLSSSTDMEQLMGDAQMSAELQFGYSGSDPDEIQRYALQRAAALHLANQIGLPQPSQDEVAAFIKGMRAFANPQGEFNAGRYAAFRAGLRSGGRVSEGDIARVVSDDVRIGQVERMLAGPGYVLPADVKDQLVRSDSKWTLDVGTVDYASFNPDIDTSETALAKFFAENSFRYEIPTRISVDAVEFPASAFVGQVSTSDSDLRAYYDQNPARFPKPVSAKTPTVAAKSDPAADFAAVRPAVEAAMKADRAKALAAKAAADFAYEIYDGKITPGASLDAFLAAHKMTARKIEPFTHEAGPTEYRGSKDIADAAFKLTSDRFYSDALPTPSGSVILLWKDLLPPRHPALAEVRAKVRSDDIEEERRKRFVALGRTLKATIESRMKEGDSFSKAAVAAAVASSVKIGVKAYPPFDLQDRPKDIDQAALGTLERLERGQVSDMAITADKGYLVYASDKKLPSLTEANPRYEETRAQLASYSSRLDSGAYLQELVDTELKRTAPPTK